VTELFDGDSFSAAGDRSPCYEGDETQSSIDLRNADDDLDMAFRLSSWLADSTGTNWQRGSSMLLN
jgi:hypothetical protein